MLRVDFQCYGGTLSHLIELFVSLYVAWVSIGSRPFIDIFLPNRKSHDDSEHENQSVVLTITPEIL